MRNIQIQVRGRKWIIKFMTNILDPESKQQLFGLCDPNTATIYVEKNTSKRIILETILHEYMHACCYEQGVHDENVPHWFEHMIINAVSKDMVLNVKLFTKIFKLLDQK